jgi:phospholipid/cholesterol/gamma-HCH transport system substrate-binding protein
MVGAEVTVGAADRTFSRTWRQIAGPVIMAAAVASLTLASCSSSEPFTLRARFADVGDLTKGAPVMMADVTVGKVTAIKLDGYSALVTMAIDQDVQVPEGATARVRRTSLLGERIVDLTVPEDVPPNASNLKSGATIARTEVRPDLEDLVKEGTAALGPITESEVATLVNEGYKGFGGRGEQLRVLLDNFGTIVKAYAGETGTIHSLIKSMNRLNTTIALKAAAHAAAVGNSERALTMLRQESGRLQSAIKALARLSDGARKIMDQHEDEMARFFSQTRTILGVLRQERAAIAGLLRYAPLHNRNTQLVEFWENNQIFQDFVICGFNEDKSDPARTCTPGRR